MAEPLNLFNLLKGVLHLSNASLPIETKLDRMLRSVSDAFQSDRCLLLRPEKIGAHGFLSRLSFEKRPLWIEEDSSLQGEDILPEERYLLSPSFACIPLWDETSCQGIFYVGFSTRRKFSPQEMEVLPLIAVEMGGVIRTEQTISELAKTTRELEKRVRQFFILWELNKALLTTVHLERILQMTLTAITIGAGLKFNRSVLFLVNEKGRFLEGTMAVGPDSAEEAGRIWTALAQKKEPPVDLITQLSPPPSDSSLNSIVKGIQIPLVEDQCILCKTVLEGRPFNVSLPQSEEGSYQIRCERGCHLGSGTGCYWGQHLSRDPKAYSFATVPIRGKGKVIGIILVDNLYNRNPITDEDIHWLSMFSDQAGLAIENARLYRNLEEVHLELKKVQALLVHREKMVALGELSATLSHEIKNPLVSIGGFARRLYRSIPAEAPEKRYAQTIIIEVARIEKILNDVLTYTREDPIDFQDCDVQTIMEDSLSMVSEGFDDQGVKLVKEFPQEPAMVKGDYQQLKQAFLNLITNSCQAMKEKGTLSIRVIPTFRNGSSYLRIEVKDTGNGIDSENLHNIFNPFYTTNQSSFGLGLAIVYKIITSHQGLIEVDNHPGKGVTFIVTLPAGEAKKGNFHASS